MLRQLWRYVHSPGLSGAAWTQLTDIEGESGNGLITYDREVIKFNVERHAAANRGYVVTHRVARRDGDRRQLSVHRRPSTLNWLRRVRTRRFTSRWMVRNRARSHRRYAAPIKLTATTTIKAIALWPNHPQSITAVMAYKKATEFQPAVTAANSTRAWRGSTSKTAAWYSPARWITSLFARPIRW